MSHKSVFKEYSLSVYYVHIHILVIPRLEPQVSLNQLNIWFFEKLPTKL